MRTYRAIGQFLNMPIEEIKNRIEGTDLRKQYELGALTDGEFCDKLAAVVGDDERRLTSELIHEFWGDIFWPNNEMFYALRCLKQQGMILVMLSNTNHLHYRQVKKDHPDLIGLFDEIVLSFEERMLKPEKGLFLKAIGMVKDDTKAPILFVDDNEEYVRGANELGMLGFVYRSYPPLAFWLRKMGLFIP
jgi:FMN phosphatase YigB (HAD superfamily)